MSAEASESVASSPEECVIYSPLNGAVKELSEVKDETFSSGTLGQGIAVIPSEGVLYAPFDGTVGMVFETKHAVSLINALGVELLIHIGLDTVTLSVKGFSAKVKAGDKVKTGDVLIEFDLDGLKKDFDVITPVLVTNADDFGAVDPVMSNVTVRAGEALMTVKK